MSIMKKAAMTAVMAFSCLTLVSGCASHHHGSGAGGSIDKSDRSMGVGGGMGGPGGTGGMGQTGTQRGPTEDTERGY